MPDTPPTPVTTYLSQLAEIIDPHSAPLETQSLLDKCLYGMCEQLHEYCLKNHNCALLDKLDHPSVDETNIWSEILKLAPRETLQQILQDCFSKAVGDYIQDHHVILKSGQKIKIQELITKISSDYHLPAQPAPAAT